MRSGLALFAGVEQEEGRKETHLLLVYSCPQ